MATKAKPKENKPESLEYRTEVKQLLDILAHSLYSDRDIFLRELISNASDALNRVQFEMLTNQNVVDLDTELAVHIVVDEDAKTLSISDAGIGMNREDMVNNLGTIAHSGAKNFLQSAGNGTGEEKPASIAEIIGQFGVGFYSAFMVAEEITVTSRSHNPDDEAYSWTSTGDSTFTLAPADRTERGTTIHITLKEDAHEYASTWKVESIIKKHSDYVSFPIFVSKVEAPKEEADPDTEESADEIKESDDPNADIEVEAEAEPTPVNQQTALWRQQPSSVKADEYKNFYQQLTYDFQDPLLNLHLVTDAPADIRSILFVPSKRERGPMMRGGEGLKLYSRKVLIQEASTDLLPEYYRFIEGVVDSEDLPLNVSREMVQSNPIMRQITKALTSRVNRELKKLADKKPAEYATFWSEFGMFIKEGVATTPADQEALVGLLRFQSTKSADAVEAEPKADSATEDSAEDSAAESSAEDSADAADPKDTSGLTSLQAYVDRMKVDQENIYYVIGDDPKSIVHSPHLDYFRANDLEVLYFTDPIDGYMVSMLREFEDKQLKNVDDSSLDLPENDDAKDDDKAKDAVPEDDYANLVERIKSVLNDRITDVSESKQLVNSPCRLVTPDGAMDRDLQRILRMTQEGYEIPKKLLELNRSHPVVVNLSSILNNDEKDPLIDATIEQLFGNALLLEGQHPNPAELVAYSQALMEAAVASRAKN